MNESHYNLLLDSVTEFNQFRMDNPDANIDLKGADFMGADFTGANLSGLDLTGVDFSGAYLIDANLSRTTLFKTNFTGADLDETDFSGTDLRNCCLSFACINWIKSDYHIQEGLLKHIAKLVLNDPEILDMDNWHGGSNTQNRCNTSHCMAGWACVLNPVAKQLEKTHGTNKAGLLTLGREAQSHFFDSNEDGFEYLIKVIAK